MPIKLELPILDNKKWFYPITYKYRAKTIQLQFLPTCAETRRGSGLQGVYLSPSAEVLHMVLQLHVVARVAVSRVEGDSASCTKH